MMFRWRTHTHEARALSMCRRPNTVCASVSVWWVSARNDIQLSCEHHVILERERCSDRERCSHLLHAERTYRSSRFHSPQFGSHIARFILLFLILLWHFLRSFRQYLHTNIIQYFGYTPSATHDSAIRISPSYRMILVCLALCVHTVHCTRGETIVTVHDRLQFS